jgi:hypothetical protein
MKKIVALLLIAFMFISIYVVVSKINFLIAFNPFKKQTEEKNNNIKTSLSNTKTPIIRAKEEKGANNKQISSNQSDDTKQAMLVSGSFVRWKNIPNSDDKYLVLKSNQENNVSMRVVLNNSSLMNNTINTRLTDEQMNEISYEKLQGLTNSETSLIIVPVFEDENNVSTVVKDEDGVTIAYWLMLN